MSRFHRITHVRETGSTNDDMAKILGEEQSRGLTLVADYQLQGAGRKGRSWIAPPGSALLCTIALPDAISAESLWVVPFWAALIVRNALARFGVETTLQWPNDVLIDSRKVAGILCISRVTGNLAWAAFGIGTNVARPQDETTIAHIHPAPAYVSDVAPVERDLLLHTLLEEADALYHELGDTSRIVAAWNKAANLPGAKYRISVDGEAQPFDAVAFRLLPGGSLLVDAVGSQREITLADARVLRE